MHQHNHDHEMAAAGGSTSPEDKVICPVMDMAVSKQQAEENGLVREVNGNKLYFCCSHCTTLFDKEPEKYAQRVGA